MPSAPRPITLRLEYVFHFASVSLFLTLIGLVITARICEIVDPDSVRGNTNVIPTLSDSTRHPTQHPFAAAATALTLYQVWFVNFILLAVAFDRDTEKKRAAWIGFTLITVFATFTGLALCVFAESALHYVFVGLGCVGLILWMCWVSFRPPFPEKKLVVRGCWVSTIISFVAGIIFFSAFIANITTLIAICEYIMATALSITLSLIAVGARGTNVFLSVNTAVTGEKGDEPDKNGSETDRTDSQKNGSTREDPDDMSQSLSALDLAVQSLV